jgi:AraC-like DNA-binding protein
VDPRDLLRRWTSAFLSEFDRAHPWPAARQVAAILRKRFAKPPSPGDLARLVGKSRSGLTRAFREEYGMSMGEYVTRVRLRRAVDQLRLPASNAKEIAAQVGYRSRTSFYEALKKYTGLRPYDIRLLSERDVERLLDSALCIRPKTFNSNPA